MSYDLKPILIKDLETSENDKMKRYDAKLFKFILNAINSNEISSIKENIEELADNIEWINTFEKNDIDKINLYYLGRISSITDLVLKLIERDEFVEKTDNALKEYALLLPVLKIIDKYNNISGTQLREELKLKSSSNLTNFYNRVKKYELIDVRKYGTSNYYSLTVKGRRLLDENMTDVKDKRSYINKKDLYIILDKIADAVSEDEPNYKQIIMHSSLKRKEDLTILENKVRRIVSKRDKYFFNKLKKGLYAKNENFVYNTTNISNIIDNYNKENFIIFYENDKKNKASQSIKKHIYQVL